MAAMKSMKSMKSPRVEESGGEPLKRKKPVKSQILAEHECPLCPMGGEDLSDWIQCDICMVWYHTACLGLSPLEVLNIAEYHCPTCAVDHSCSILKRASSRKRLHLDYNALNNGDIGAILKGETSDSAKRHAYVKRFHGGSTFVLNNIPESDGSDLTSQWAFENGIKTPKIVRKTHFHNLNMKIPEGLSVDRVTELVGEELPVEVMDVSTQLNSPGWTMAQWRDYYNSPEDERDKILNVISLEFSQTRLADEVVRPQIVRDLDLLDKVWPQDLRLNSDIPHVSLYCLMSVKDSYTDFHVDFGGSSVFYHVSQGKKTFLFVEPTKQNLSKYEKWCLSSDQNATFFADIVDECHRVDLDQGDSLIIPSGWIHAVYTPVDSLVIGGNFLTPINIPTQLQLTAIEKRTRVPQKFRFPHFTRVMWYTLLYYTKLSPDARAKLTAPEIEGMRHLYDYLSNVIKPLSTEPNTSKQYKNILKTIPKPITKRPDESLQMFLALINELSTSHVNMV